MIWNIPVSKKKKKKKNNKKVQLKKKSKYKPTMNAIPYNIKV